MFILFFLHFLFCFLLQKILTHQMISTAMCLIFTVQNVFIFSGYLNIFWSPKMFVNTAYGSSARCNVLVNANKSLANRIFYKFFTPDFDLFVPFTYYILFYTIKYNIIVKLYLKNAEKEFVLYFSNNIRNINM